MQTPLFIATTSKGEVFEFFTNEEYEEWAKKAPKHKAEYFKGLGGFDTDTFERFITNIEKYLIKITKLETEDMQSVTLAFSESEADSRKDWLQSIRYFDSVDE